MPTCEPVPGSAGDFPAHQAQGAADRAAPPMRVCAYEDAEPDEEVSDDDDEDDEDDEDDAWQDEDVLQAAVQRRFAGSATPRIKRA